jgi:pimeloyl-ACP methyl ester carboxylesterase
MRVGGVLARAVTDIKGYIKWAENSESKSVREIYNAITTLYTDDSVYDANCVIKHYKKLTMPIFLSHGTADKTIPVSEARNLAELLQGRDDFVYHEIEGGGHDAPLKLRPRAMDEIFNYLDHGKWQL